MTAKVMQMVNDLIGQGRWEEAQAVLTRLSDQSPGDPEVEFQLGVLAYSGGNYDQAERHLKKALESLSDKVEVHYYLGLTLLKLKRPAEALVCFRDACERQADSACSHLYWGMSLADMGSYRGAIGQYNQAIKLNANFVSAYYAAGLAFHKLNQYEEALNYFQKAIDLDPNFAEAYNGLALMQMALHRESDALASFARAAKLNDKLVVVQKNWASALSTLGRFLDATERYQAIIASGAKPLSARERAQVFSDWGVNLFYLERYEEACEKLIEAVDIDPGLVGARLNLGMVQHVLKEYEQAAGVFEKALETHPQIAEVRLFLGIAYFFAGHYQESLNMLLEAKDLQLHHPDLDMWIAYCEAALNHYDLAETYFAQAIKSNDKNFLAYDGYGSCLMRDGKYEEALAKLSSCIQINPNYGLGHWHLARCLDALDRKEEANKHFHYAVEFDPRCLEPEKKALEKLLKQKNHALASEKAQRLMEVAFNDPEVKILQAKILLSQNQLDESEALLQEVLTALPEHGPANEVLGEVYLSAGKFVEADEQFRLACERVEGDVPLYIAWGKTLLLLGFHELALEKFAYASELDPYDVDTYEIWGTTLKTLGRYQESADVYKRAQAYL